jgi:hypothetical protein
MSGRYRLIAAAAVVAVIAGFVVFDRIRLERSRNALHEEAAQTLRKWRGPTQELFDLLRPVALSKCRLERFGEVNDGGYLLCGNLLDDARSGYSYGINGYDQWGCDVSTRLKVPVHQYDCFNLTVPACGSGRTVFHAECVAAGPRYEEERPFDAIAAHLERNGDATNRVVMKIDVEGAEWESLMAAPDEVLERVDQLAIEFHGVKQERYLDVVRRLKRFFHVAHVHFNNYSCETGLAPFPAWAYEVLFVNRKLDDEDRSKTPGGLLPIDSPNNPSLPDCQTAR